MRLLVIMSFLLTHACTQGVSEEAAMVVDAKCAAEGGFMATTNTSGRERCVQLPSKTDLYPPEVDAFVLQEAPGEPRLWTVNAAQGFSQRLRMLEVYLPPSEAFLVRIDTEATGSSIGHIVRLRHVEFTSDWTVLDRRQFSIAPGQMDRLNSLVRQTDFPKGNFRGQNEEEDSCTDGHHVIIERATPTSGYGFAAGNLRCGKTPAVEAVVAEMRALAALQ